MMDVSHSDLALFAPVFLCPASSVLDSFNSREQFNPVGEEPSTESEERGETDSEEMSQVAASEDEFAEDELSLGREKDVRLKKGKKQDDCFLRGFNIVYRDLASDSGNRRTLLDDSEINLKEFVPSDHKEERKRRNGGFYFDEAKQKSKSSARKKIWKNKTPPTLREPPADCNEFHEGFLPKKILHFYPDVTDTGLERSRRTPIAQSSSVHSFGKTLCESLSAFDNSNPHRTKPDIFSTFRDGLGSVKNQNQDSFLGSDSRYGNNTLGGKSSRTSRERTLINCKNPVLS